MGILTAEDMKVLICQQDRDFFEAVSSGNDKKVQSMLQRNRADLASITLRNGMLPIHVAASCGHRTMLRMLSQRTTFDGLDSEQKAQLFLITVKNNMFDVAVDMLGRYPTLVDSRDEEHNTAWHLLARKQIEDFWGGTLVREQQLKLIKLLLESIRRKNDHEMLEFEHQSRGVLFEAAKSGNFLIIAELVKFNPLLSMVLDSERRSLLHTAALYGRVPISLIMGLLGRWKYLVMQAVDKDGNNILHMAGMVSPYQRFESPRPDRQMLKEQLHFKEVEELVPIAFKSMSNNEGHTPKEIFYSKHRDLMVKAEAAMKNKANYGMLVATIIATIVFAAALTVPGHDVSPEANSLILQKEQWYIAFILSDAVALFTSSLSIIIFLTVLTSGYKEDEFNTSLLKRLTSGVATLLLAVAAMVFAFAAACFLIFKHQSSWIAYLVYLFGFIVVLVFSSLLNTLYVDLIATLREPTAYLIRASQIRNNLESESDEAVSITWNGPSAFKKILTFLLEMCQNAKPELEDNGVAEA